MQKYPDDIVILEIHNGGNPFQKKAAFRVVYQGKCRCYLNKPAAFRVTKVMDCDYGVVIPDRSMVSIGENFKVGIRFHNSKTNKSWDLVGYVKDFARYDRVCNLYFQMVKENLIEEDMPARWNDDEWPIIKGMNMQYVSFYMASGMVNLPYWAYNGDWSQETDMSHKFDGCTNLKEVDVSTAVNAETFESCFNGCASLESVHMPPSLNMLGRDGLIETFNGAASLEEIYMPANTSLNMVRTFSGCLKLKKVIFESFTNAEGDTNPCVWEHAFDYCEALEVIACEGVLGGKLNDFQNTGLEFCTLTPESLHNIAMALYDQPEQDGQNNVFNFGPENVANLTDVDRAILSQKGWIAT